MTDIVPAIAGSAVAAPGMDVYSPPTPETSSTDLDKDTFLKLLVAQLKYQDPLEPSSSEDFIATTAQFTTVEKLEELTEQGANSALINSLTTASSLVGKSVTALQDGVTTTATVLRSQIVSGDVHLVTDKGTVRLNQIVSIGPPPTGSEPTTPVEATEPGPAPIEPVIDPDPTATQPVTDPGPTATEPTATEPVTDTNPTATEPTATEPTVDSEPTATEPTVDSEPPATEPPETEPPATDTNPIVDAEPIAAEPIAAEPTDDTNPIDDTEPIAAEPIVDTNPIVDTEPIAAEPIVDTEQPATEPVTTTQAGPNIDGNTEPVAGPTPEPDEATSPNPTVDQQENQQ